MKVLRRLAIAVAAVLVLAAAWLALSPAPNAALLRLFGDDGFSDATADSSTLSSGLTEQLDLQIGGEDDARIDVFRPVGDELLPAVVWVHGGDFVSGTKEPLRPFLKTLAARGFVTVNVEYSKAPEQQYPRPVEQVDHALEHVLEHAAEYGVDERRFVLGGDAAGAHIAAQTALATTDRQYAQSAGGLPRSLPGYKLRGLVLFGGPFDLSLVSSNNPFSQWHLKKSLWAYTGVRSVADDDALTWLSIVDHVSSQTPPVFISAGPDDPLLPHARALAARLTDISVDVDALFFDRTASQEIGTEYQLALATPPAREAMDRVVAFLDEVTGD